MSLGLVGLPKVSGLPAQVHLRDVSESLGTEKVHTKYLSRDAAVLLGGFVPTATGRD